MLSAHFLLHYNMFFEYGIQAFFFFQLGEVFRGEYSRIVWVWGLLAGTGWRALMIFQKNYPEVTGGQAEETNCCCGQGTSTGPTSPHVFRTCLTYCFKINKKYLGYLSPNSIHSLNSWVDMKNDERLRDPHQSLSIKNDQGSIYRILHSYEIDPCSYAQRKVKFRELHV